MPIRINLLAEEQAAEEMRRKDPVKRAIWMGAFVVVLVLVWSGWQQMKVRAAVREESDYEAQWKKLEKDFNRVTENVKKNNEIDRKRIALRTLSTNRFLWGNPLNALQQAMVDNVQLIRLRTSQTFVLTEETKPTTTDTRVIPGKPPTSTEKITITIEAKDFGSPPGSQVNQFKEAIATYPYFKEHLNQVDGVKLVVLSPPDLTDPRKPFVIFTLSCTFPEKTRTK